MYHIIKDGAILSTEDKLRYTKHQSNGIDCLCSKEEADGIVVNNDYIEPLPAVTIEEFNGAAMLAEYEQYYNSVSAEIGGE